MNLKEFERGDRGLVEVQFQLSPEGTGEHVEPQRSHLRFEAVPEYKSRTLPLYQPGWCNNFIYLSESCFSVMKFCRSTLQYRCFSGPYSIHLKDEHFGDTAFIYTALWSRNRIYTEMGSFHGSENLDYGLLRYDAVGLPGGSQCLGKKSCHSTLKMEAADSSETLVTTYETARCHSRESHDPHYAVQSSKPGIQY